MGSIIVANGAEVPFGSLVVVLVFLVLAWLMQVGLSFLQMPLGGEMDIVIAFPVSRFF